MSSLKSATIGCIQAFALLSSNLKGHNDLQDRLEDALEEGGRLKIWAGNLGALARGHSALDWRLRDASVMRTSILMLLEELRNLVDSSA
jgi:hypothetical protein